MANPADSRLIAPHNCGERSPMCASGRRGKPRLYRGVDVVSFDHDDGVDVIGHHHIPVDDYVLVVARNGFHFGFSNDFRVGNEYLPVDHMPYRAFLVWGAKGDKVPAA